METDTLVRLTNDLLSQLHVPERITQVSDINERVFVTLFEGLCGEKLQDVVPGAARWEDRVHNVQTVIDTLSLDVLNTSLSHITGEAIVKGDQHDITNLIEVFFGLFEFMLDRISSDCSTDNEDDDYRYEDPDLVTSEVIDSILDHELTTSKRTLSHKSGTDLDNTSYLISLGRGVELSSHVSANDTSHLVALGDTTSDKVERGYRHNNKNNALSQSTRSRSNRSAVSTTTITTTTADESTQALINEAANIDPPIDGSTLSTTDISSYLPTPATIQPQLHKQHTKQLLKHSSSSLTSVSSISAGAQSILRSSAEVGQDVPDHAPPNATSLPPNAASLHIYLHATPGLSASLPISSSGPVAGKQPSDTVLHESIRGYGRAPPAYRDISGITKPQSVANHHALEDKTTTMRHNQFHPQTHSVSNIRNVPSSYELNTNNNVNSDLHVSDLHVEQPHVSQQSELAPRSNAIMNTSAASKPTSTTSRDSPAPSTIDHELSEALRTQLRSVRQEVSCVEKTASHHSIPEPYTNIVPQTSDTAVDTASLAEMYGKSSHQKVSFSDASGNTRSRNRKSGNRKHDSAIDDILVQDAPVTSAHQTSRPRAGTTATSMHQFGTRSLPHTSVANELAPPRQQDSTSTRYYADSHPKTFQDYRDKYYSTVDARDALARDSTYHSDSELDYRQVENESGEAEVLQKPDQFMPRNQHRNETSNQDDTITSTLDSSLHRMHDDLQWLRNQVRNNRAGDGSRKAVRFEDILDDSAPGHMDGLRHKLSAEERKQRSKTDVLGKMYACELRDYAEKGHESMQTTRKKVQQTEKAFKNKAIKVPKKCKYTKPVKKYAVTSTNTSSFRTRPQAKTTRGRKRSVSASPIMVRKRDPESDLLPWLLEEFPFLHLSTETLHDLWRRSAQQMEQLSRAEQEVRRKKSKAQVQIEEGERRQKILLDIMKKELSHNQRMKELKDRQTQQQLVKSKMHDKRQQSARARKYYDEFQLRMRSKMLKKRTREEAVFKSLFQDGLSIQKERIRDLRRYAKEQREVRNKRQQDDIESMENYYRDQFSMLAESMSKERSDLEIRDKAQSKVLQQMKSELRRKMETEITSFQQQLYRDEDDEYFRQLDADRLRHTLQMARFQAHV